MSNSSSFASNILSNYVSQLYVTIIGIVVVPMYFKYMGAEAYGLVGFFALLQVWFNLLDMGLTATLTRETACLRGGATDGFSYRRLLRAMEVIFIVVAVAGSGAIFTASGYIANDWLQSSQLPITEIQKAVQLMAAIAALRWMCSLYRGIITGSERQMWLSGYNSLIASLRFIGVLLILIYIGATPTIFFSFQLVVAVLELIGLLFKAYSLLPSITHCNPVDWSWTLLKPKLKFSLSISFVSLVWVLVTQTDKMVLSKILPLAEYGYFTFAVLVASVIRVVTGPISTAILPRITMLEAEGDHTGLIRIYRHSTQMVAVVAGATSITLAFSAELLLWVWTGDKALAHRAAPILTLYALGNGILAVSAFPYYLQYAKGDLRLHLIGNVLFLVLLVPSIIWGASQFGGVGAGYVWLGVNLIIFVAWLPIIHNKFEPDLNLKWYAEDTLIIFLSIAMAGHFLRPFFLHGDSRWSLISGIIAFGFMVLLAGACASSFVRAKAKIWFCQRQKKQEGLA